MPVTPSNDGLAEHVTSMRKVTMMSEAQRSYQGRQHQPRDAHFDHPETWSMKAMNTDARDTDGTIDWVPDPPEKLKKWLLLLKIQNQSKGIGLEQQLRFAGAKSNGLMQKDQFGIALTSYIYREWFWSKQLLKSIYIAYGTGLEEPDGTKESVAWKDFCEDVEAQVRWPSRTAARPRVRP